MFCRNFSLRLIFQWSLKILLHNFWDILILWQLWDNFAIFPPSMSLFETKTWICKHDFGLFVPQFTWTAKKLRGMGDVLRKNYQTHPDFNYFCPVLTPLEFATNSIDDYKGQRTLPAAEGPKQNYGWVCCCLVWVVGWF